MPGEDARDRFQSASDLAFALEAVAIEGRSGSTAAVPAPRGRLLPGAALAAGVILIAAAALVAWPWNGRAVAPTTRLAMSIAAPAGIAVAVTPAVSPNGRAIAFVGSSNGARSRIFVRSLDTFETRPVAGTEGADGPFWSPDSRSLGFFARARLWRVDLGGGLPRTIATVSDPRGGTWGPDNVIVYAPHPDAGLYRVSADGGAAAELTTLNRDKQEISHRFPRWLPGGQYVLFMNRVATSQLTRYTITAVPATGGSIKPLLDAMSPGVYDSGRLLFGRDDKLFAQRFDPETLTASGEPELVVDGVWNDGQGVAGLVGFDAVAGVPSGGPFSRDVCTPRGGAGTARFWRRSRPRTRRWPSRHLTDVSSC